MSTLWHAEDPEVILHRLGADADRGLAPAESTRRLREHGPNVLSAAGEAAGPGLLARQFLDPPTLALLLAAVICARLGEPFTALLLAAAAVANASLAAFRERPAWHRGAALARLSAPAARVVRGGKSFLIPAAELVPGDLAEVKAGDRVPADLRLRRASGLVVDESALTGGSFPVGKDAGQVLPERTAVADRSNMLFAGTLVTAGEGAGFVIATGMRTELGRIARLLGDATAPPPPLRVRLADLGQAFGLAVCAAAVAAALRLRGGSTEALLAAVATLAVAGVPAALPATVAFALAAGVRRLRRGGVVLRTPATAETLGGVGVIVTDKTGTLTRDEMTVRELALEDELIEVTGSGYAPEGRILRGGDSADPQGWEALGIALRIGALCSSAASLRRDEAGAWRVDGDPIDGALLTLAAKGGVWRDDLAREQPLLAVFPDTVERRRMTALVVGRGGRPTALTKGDPDAVLALCLHHRTASGVRPLSPADRERILLRAEEMAGRALRVVGLAYREDATGLDARSVERSLVWVGLAGAFDPPREGIAAAVADGLTAGIVPVIVTGDQREAALALAREIGALLPGDEGITGEELDLLTPEALGACIERYRVCARANAGHKLRIVRAWKSRGCAVAMIGAGVSDAPALREADVGIALGGGGSEIAREEAAVRIDAGGFASIVAAVTEGRRVGAGVARSITFLLALTAAGMVVALAAVVFALPPPLTPIRLLWVVLTAGLAPALALALGASAAEPQRAPALPARERARVGASSQLALAGGGIALATLAAVVAARFAAVADAARIGAHAVAALALSALAYALCCLRPARPPVAVAGGADRWLLPATALSALLTVAAIHLPLLRGALGLAPLARGEWVRVLLLATLPLLATGGWRGWFRVRRGG